MSTAAEEGDQIEGLNGPRSLKAGQGPKLERGRSVTFISNRLLKTLAEPCHSEPVRFSAANGSFALLRTDSERSEGAQGKLREESRFETKVNTRFLVAYCSSNDSFGEFFNELLSRSELCSELSKYEWKEIRS